ncbi:MAG: sigma-70 family RNA polymerase sigma factor [Anaerolineae bacterium]|nr:sigma-70 family RNA polymerase sigma factor [Anaerolineae bacterium]
MGDIYSSQVGGAKLPPTQCNFFPAPLYILVDMMQITDIELVQHTLNGDIELFGDLVQRYQQSVFNVCYRMLAERRDAEDLAQETFVRAYHKLNSFDQRRPFGPWVRKIAANLCLNHINLARPPQVDLEKHLEVVANPAGSTPEHAYLSAEASAQVRRAIWDLPGKYRAVIELRHFHNLSYQEIAAALEIPLSDVKSHLFRARKRLADDLREKYGPIKSAH